MRLTIPGARAVATAWLYKRNLPPARYIAQKGYDAGMNGRRYVILLPVEKLSKTMPLMELVVHDDSSVTVVSDTSMQVLNELLSQGINAYRLPRNLNHRGSFEFFLASVKAHSDIPEWFVGLDVWEPLQFGELCDAYANAWRTAERIMSIPVKILPTRDQKRAHMRPLSSQMASKTIVMVVNNHLPAGTVSTEFFTRLTHMRQCYLGAKE